MRRLTRSGTVVIAALWLAIVPFWFLLPRDTLFEILNGLCISTCAGVVVAFWPGAWPILAIKPSKWAAGDVLILGTVVVATGIVGTFVGLWLYRATGSTGFSNSLVSAVFRWIVVTGTLMHLVASGSNDGRIPIQAYRRAGIAIAIGLAATTIFISIGF